MLPPVVVLNKRFHQGDIFFTADNKRRPLVQFLGHNRHNGFSASAGSTPACSIKKARGAVSYSSRSLPSGFLTVPG
jgi:hypothetical protein